MKTWKKILLIVFIIFAVIFSIAYVFVVTKGKAILTKQLENLTHKKTTVGYCGLTPPLHFEIRNLEIENLVKIDSIFISPNPLSLLTGRLVINSLKIVKPQLIYGKAPAPVKDKSVMAVTVPPQNARSAKQIPLRVVIRRLKIKDGKLDFVDQAISPDGLSITVKDIDCSISQLYLYPSSAITNFSFSAKIPWREGTEEGKVNLDGWINVVKKDIQASLKIEDIDGVYLYPYYSNWVDLDKARIEKAKLNFTSEIQGLSNNVTANCHLELADIVRRPLEQDEPEQKASKIADAVLGIFRALNQGKIVLDFTVKTKMDRPEFSFGNIRTAFEDKITKARKGEGITTQSVLTFPVKLATGTINAATDLTKTVITGTFAVGKLLKQSVEDAFRKEKKEVQ
jgi:hypothetical protein